MAKASFVRRQRSGNLMSKEKYRGREGNKHGAASGEAVQCWVPLAA